MVDFGTQKCSARSASNRWLASPSRGGASTETRYSVSEIFVTWVLLALELTVTPILNPIIQHSAVGRSFKYETNHWISRPARNGLKAVETLIGTMFAPTMLVSSGRTSTDRWRLGSRRFDHHQ